MADQPARHHQPSEAESLLHAVDVSVADAEADLELVLRQPLLLDPQHPSTARFLAERARVRRLIAGDPSSWAARDAADGLSRAWSSLREEARRAGLSGRPWRQRRRIRRARRLLEQARSDRGSPALRVRAFRRGLRLLDGLVTVPEPLQRTLLEAASAVPPPRTPGPDFPTYG